MRKPEKRIPAGSGEKIQYLAHDFNDNTVRFALLYPGHLRPEIMSAATSALTGSVDILHASFIPGSLSAHWQVNSDYSENDCFTYLETEADPWEIASDEMLRPILPDSLVQIHCTCISGKDTCALVLTASHLCVDGGDGKYLLNKLAEAYRLIAQTGNASGLKVKSGSRAPEQLYRDLTPTEYLSLMKPESSGIKTAFPFPSQGCGHPRLLSARIPAQTMDAARKRARETGATANDLLLAACYRAFAALPGVEAESALSILSMMDLRRHCVDGESEGLCNLSGFMPTVLREGVQGDFTHTLTQLSTQTRRAKEDPRAGMAGLPLFHSAAHTTPLRLLLQMSEHVYGNLSIGLTNLGSLSCEPLILDGIRPSDGLFAGPLKKKPSMQISAAGFDGSVALCSIGSYEQEDACLLQNMLDRMVQEIADYAAGAVH